jgi:NDP-sugar pyrophosphorylase family protein
VPKINQIVILNGGYGSRVRSVSGNLPKCLIKIGGIPFLFHQLDLIKKAKIRNVVLCLGYKSQYVINFLKKNYKGLNIIYVIEKKKLGTGGALINSLKYLKQNFFLTYGDSWLNVNYVSLQKIFFSKNKSLITVVPAKIIKNHDANIYIKYGIIKDYNKVKINRNYKYIDYGLMIFKKKLFLNYKIKKIDLSILISNFIKENLIDYKIVYKKFYQIGDLKGIKELKKYYHKYHELP